MFAVHPSTPLASLLRRALAAGTAALVLALAVLAASPELHGLLHSQAIGADDDGCAVAQFAGGVSLAPAAVLAPPAAADWTVQPPVAAAEIFLVSPRYLRQPERGPPVG